jgi:hypothetical protein
MQEVEKHPQVPGFTEEEFAASSPLTTPKGRWSPMRNGRLLTWCALISLGVWISACGSAEATPIETAATMLQEIAEPVCPIPVGLDDKSLYHQFSSSDGASQFECLAAAGHTTVTTLSWFDTPDEADAAFAARREGHMVTEFHGFPLLMWEEDDPSFPGERKEHRIWLWQANQWLIEIRAFDDTHFIIAPDPGTVAEAIYQAGIERGLFTIGEQ